MINLILKELFDDLAHKLVLWLKFYKFLSLLLDKLKGNLNSLSTIISTKIDSTKGHMIFDYNYVSELGEVLNLLTSLEKYIICLLVYDNDVYNFIKKVSANVQNVPPYFSGISKVNFFPNNGKIGKEVLDICYAIKEKIMSIKDSEKRENKKQE